MGQDPEEHFAVLAFVLASRQRRSEMPFESGEHRFSVGSATVAAIGKTTMHLGAVFALWLLSFELAGVQFDGGQADAEFLARQNMVVFAIVSGVGQKAIDVKIGGRLSEGRREVRRILAGAASQTDPGDQMRLGVRDGGDLGPRYLLKWFTVMTARGVVPADVAGLEAGGIDGAFGLVIDQVPLAGAVEDGSEEPSKALFFRSFCSA